MRTRTICCWPGCRAKPESHFALGWFCFRHRLYFMSLLKDSQRPSHALAEIYHPLIQAKCEELIR